MSKRLIPAAVMFAFLLSFPSIAGYADLELVVSGVVDNHVTISVHNPLATSISARAQVTVVLDDGTSETLTTPNFSISGNVTFSATLTAARAIVAIGDEPQPFPTVQ